MVLQNGVLFVNFRVYWLAEKLGVISKYFTNMPFIKAYTPTALSQYHFSFFILCTFSRTSPTGFHAVLVLD